ncbi:hypothetical protein WA1_07535 [Scytonema hofmannii PCC 7110]|uniref:Uncharacterized protein n=2 Tax=Scytonema hofmannii TaxID=34078 RepID=A0A139WT92_9CYAN|nr:hypothetical protein WA1_07535 [Scytonema hofmannii PCC 7110]
MCEDTAINRVTNMTSSESNSISLDIHRPPRVLFPNKVAYPIPQNEMGINTPIRLSVSIFNKTSTRFRLHPLQPILPELLTLDGQIIQRRLVTDADFTNNQQNTLLQRNQGREAVFFQIPPNCSSGFDFPAKFLWEHNILRLKIPTIPMFSPNSFHPTSFWCFDGLEAENYQLRWILNTYDENTLSDESNINRSITVGDISSRMLATPWLNLRLVQPLSTDNRAIEVDGVRFKIEMPESVLTIPNRQTGNKTDVKLGIQVINNTSNSLRFYQPSSIDMYLTDDENRAIQILPEKISPGKPKLLTDYSVQSGKSAFFSLNGVISWRNKNVLQIAFPRKTRQQFTGNDSYFNFGELTANQFYHLQVTYKIPESATHLEKEVLEKVWTGWVTLPSVQLTLVEP